VFQQVSLKADAERLVAGEAEALGFEETRHVLVLRVELGSEASVLDGILRQDAKAREGVRVRSALDRFRHRGGESSPSPHVRCEGRRAWGLVLYCSIPRFSALSRSALSVTAGSRLIF